jgi:hypothetical protein
MAGDFPVIRSESHNKTERNGVDIHTWTPGRIEARLARGPRAAEGGWCLRVNGAFNPGHFEPHTSGT